MLIIYKTDKQSSAGSQRTLTVADPFFRPCLISRVAVAHPRLWAQPDVHLSFLARNLVCGIARADPRHVCQCHIPITFGGLSLLVPRNGSFAPVECELSYGVHVESIIAFNVLSALSPCPPRAEVGRGGISRGRSEERYVPAGNAKMSRLRGRQCTGRNNIS
jgi:hypothetical protein